MVDAESLVDHRLLCYFSTEDAYLCNKAFV